MANLSEVTHVNFHLADNDAIIIESHKLVRDTNIRYVTDECGRMMFVITGQCFFMGNWQHFRINVSQSTLFNRWFVSTDYTLNINNGYPIAIRAIVDTLKALRLRCYYDTRYYVLAAAKSF